MNNNRFALNLLIGLLLITSCQSTSQKEVHVYYLKEDKLCDVNIALDFIGDNGSIQSVYIDTIKCSYLDSITYSDMIPDHGKYHTTPYALNFSKNIKPYSPEYYAAYTVYNLIKAIKYYEQLFDNKIDFNTQKSYKTIDIILGDIPLLSSPNSYIFKENSNPSPSLFAHEIGHRAFWYIEEELGIKFNGLSIVHMGLLEYFTVSFNHSSVVGEGFLPKKLIRDAAQLHKYPLDSSLVLRTTFQLLEESFPTEIQNKESSISSYLATCYTAYSQDILDNVYDNHRVGMVLTSTLWRIRGQLGQEKTDKLVAQTILNLNSYLYKRGRFYQSKEPPREDSIDWYDVFYGLIQQDNELYSGKNSPIIISEFAKTGYPIEMVQL